MFGGQQDKLDKVRLKQSATNVAALFLLGQSLQGDKPITPEQAVKLVGEVGTVVFKKYEKELEAAKVLRKAARAKALEAQKKAFAARQKQMEKAGQSGDALRDYMTPGFAGSYPLPADEEED
jgi:hypothetical protein